METILKCSGLTKRYSGSLPVLRELNLSLQGGKIAGLLGPNGSGKTTLIKLAAGLLTPDGGAIEIDGQAPGIETKAKVSYLPERDTLPGWMRAGENVAYYADFFEDFDRAKAGEMLRELGIDPAMRLRTMSKGTREKVQLILAMSRKARLYLLDEPIGGVDPAARDYILTTIIQNYSEEAAVVISTHLIADVEKVLDEAIFLSGGQVALQMGVDELREERGMGVDAVFREVFRC
ncbi:ABC transporter ATP-binding protein [Ruminococcaceae bacterium OttesenSCG-928-I18]|nr:ABC transporter ATP-binding protein [Ruminococcaceae bacterium OttesenSCG-928-I18]